MNALAECAIDLNSPYIRNPNLRLFCIQPSSLRDYTEVCDDVTCLFYAYPRAKSHKQSQPYHWDESDTETSISRIIPKRWTRLRHHALSRHWIDEVWHIHIFFHNYFPSYAYIIECLGSRNK